MKWILTHDSHHLKKGDVYEGDNLPAWLVGKASLVEEKSFKWQPRKKRRQRERKQSKLNPHNAGFLLGFPWL